MTTTAIINARIFDGTDVLEATTLVVDGTEITAVGGEIPEARRSTTRPVPPCCPACSTPTSTPANPRWHWR